MRFFLQKKIIALAVAGLVSGVAFAQTNVTVYGRADLGYVYSKSDFRKFHGIENGNGIGGGANRIGFMGEEGLGGGLKAIFKFEWGLNADEGGGPVNARYTYVGLGGSFGAVTLGRNGTPSDLYMGATSPWGINGIEPIARFRADNVTLMDGVRWNNSIAYASPSFSGLDFMAIYSFGEKTNSRNKNGNGEYNCTAAVPGYGSVDPVPAGCTKSYKGTDEGRLGLGVKYANGPIYAAAVFHAQADSAKRGAPGVDWNWTAAASGAKGWGIGGSYDLKVVKLYANYFYQKANHNGRGGNGRGSDKQSAWSLSVGVPVSANGTVVAEYAQHKDNLKRFVDPNTKAISIRADGKTGKAKGYSLGYRHNLSKRTTLYTYVSQFDNDKGITTGWDKTRVGSKKQTDFTVGVIHVF